MKKSPPRRLFSFTLHSSSAVFPAEHVTLAPTRQDQRRIEILVDLGPQVADVNVNHIRCVFVVFVVQMFPDLATGSPPAHGGTPGIAKGRIPAASVLSLSPHVSQS